MSAYLIAIRDDFRYHDHYLTHTALHMGNCFGSKDTYEDDEYLDGEGEEGEVVISQRYTYAKHRKSRFEQRRETDDPASDSDDQLQRLAAEIDGGESSKKKGKKRSKKFEQNNNMLLELLEGNKKKKGFFSRKFAKLRGKIKKSGDKDNKQDKKDKKDKEKKDKLDKKKEGKEMKEMNKAKKKAKNKAATKQAMQDAMGEPKKDTPPKQDKQLVFPELNLRESITSMRGRERSESVADKMLSKQMVKYKERFGFKKNAPTENSTEV